MARPLRLSQDEEDRLVDIVDSVADAVAGGADPDDAIVKAARDSHLPAGHIPLIVRAFNTGQAGLARKTASTLLDKVADYPLADTERILAELYPKEPKQASARLSSRELDLPPTWYDPEFDPEQIPRIRDKQAAVDQAILELDRKRQVPVSEELQRKNEKRAFVTARDSMETERRRLTQELDDADDLVQDLVTYYRRPGAEPLVDVRRKAAFLLGAGVQSVCDRIARTLPETEKAASATLHRPVDLTQAPYRQIQAILAACDRVKVAQARFEAAEQAFQQVCEDQRPKPLPVEDPEAQLPGGLQLSKAAFNNFSTALGVALSRDAISNVMNRLGVPEKDTMTDRAYRSIASPEHEQALASIGTRANLATMMAGDPIISSYDPHEVATAFNELAGMAPRASQQPAMMSGLLRKRLAQGVLDPFDGSQLVGTEANFRKLESPGQHLQRGSHGARPPG